MPISFLTATIPAGQSLSNAINFSSARLVRIKMPDDWTPANLTFQLSPSGTDFADLYAVNGSILQLLQLAVIPKVSVIVLMDWPALQYMRIRSGLPDIPIIQQAARSFTFTSET